MWCDASAAPVCDARSFVGDERDYDARSTLYADSSASIDERREHRVLGSRATDGWTQAAGDVGWFADSSQQRGQIFSGEWGSAFYPFGEVASLCARSEPR